MPIAKLNRDALRTLAEIRLEESRILLANQQWSGAYYLAGLGVECALKSVMAGRVKEYDYPDLSFIRKMYDHELDQLFGLDVVLWAAFQVDMKVDPKLRANWSTVKDWKVARRYEIIAELEARDMYDAATEPVSGVVEWIKARW